MFRIMEDAVDRRLKLAGRLLCDCPTGVAVVVKAREIAAGNFQAHVVAWQEYIGCGP